MSFHKKAIGVLLSFGVYILLNVLFAHIGLLIAERRIVVFPYLTGLVCGKPTGFEAKMAVILTIFLLSRVAFLYVLRKSNVYKIKGLDVLAGLYVVTDFLPVWLFFLIPAVNWDVYFYTAWPILRIKKMFGYHSWICFLAVGTICSSCYQFLFKKKLSDYVNFILLSTISFALAFLVYYISLGRIIYVE
ncbi:MAG: hypothetical protein U0X91_20365 [Spirosomataceae bacterium]